MRSTPPNRRRRPLAPLSRKDHNPRMTVFLTVLLVLAMLGTLTVLGFGVAMRSAYHRDESFRRRPARADCLGRAEFERKISAAEEQLWQLTASDQPSQSSVEAKAREIERMRADERLAFIRAVGEAAKVLTDRGAINGLWGKNIGGKV